MIDNFKCCKSRLANEMMECKQLKKVSIFYGINIENRHKLLTV